MNLAQLENIELRLCGATHTPWKNNHHGAIVVGRRKDVRKATKAALIESEQPIKVGSVEEPNYFDEEELRTHVVVLEQGPLADDDTMDFVAHAPSDVEALVREVRANYAAAAKLSESLQARSRERNEWQLRAETAEQELAAVRETLRRFAELFASVQEGMK